MSHPRISSLRSAGASSASNNDEITLSTEETEAIIVKLDSWHGHVSVDEDGGCELPDGARFQLAGPLKLIDGTRNSNTSLAKKNLKGGGKPTLWAPIAVIYPGLRDGSDVGSTPMLGLDGVAINMKPRSFAGYGSSYIDIGIPTAMYVALVNAIDSGLDVSGDVEVHPMTYCQNDDMVWVPMSMLGQPATAGPNTSIPPIMIKKQVLDDGTLHLECDLDSAWNSMHKSCTSVIRTNPGMYEGTVFVNMSLSTVMSPGENYENVLGFCHGIKFKVAGIRVLSALSGVTGPVISKNVAPVAAALI